MVTKKAIRKSTDDVLVLNEINHNIYTKLIVLMKKWNKNGKRKLLMKQIKENMKTMLAK